MCRHRGVPVQGEGEQIGRRPRIAPIRTLQKADMAPHVRPHERPVGRAREVGEVRVGSRALVEVLPAGDCLHERALGERVGARGVAVQEDERRRGGVLLAGEGRDVQVAVRRELGPGACGKGPPAGAG